MFRYIGQHGSSDANSVSKVVDASKIFLDTTFLIVFHLIFRYFSLSTKTDYGIPVFTVLIKLNKTQRFGPMDDIVINKPFTQIRTYGLFQFYPHFYFILWTIKSFNYE